MRPRILFLHTACPFGPISGAGIRTKNIASILGSIGKVTMVAASERPWTVDQLKAVKDVFDFRRLIRYVQTPTRGLVGMLRREFDSRYMNTNGVGVSPEDRHFVEQLRIECDMVWIHTLKVANAYRKFLWHQSVLDVDDVPSKFHKLAARQSRSLFEKIDRTRRSISARRYEQRCLDRFDLVTVCNDEDRGLFTDPDRVHVVRNGFEVPVNGCADAQWNSNPRIGMIGDFGHLPNADGLKWFVEGALPHIKKVFPEVCLRLVGKKSPELASQFQERSLSGLGYVESVEDEMRTWNMMIVPTRMGGGTHLKFAEGMARRVPMVSTTHGTRGYKVVHGTHVLIADTAESFAACCIEMLRTPALSKKVAEAAYNLFEEEYSWSSIAPSIERAVENCLKGCRTASR